MQGFYQQLIETETQLGVLPKNQSYFLQSETKSDTCVLAIHGYLANPNDTRILGDFVHQNADVDVLGIRMSGHGLTPERLKDTNWQEWVSSVHRGYKAIQEHYDKCILLGLSGGALVALNLAEETTPTGVICLSTMLHASDWRLKYGGVAGPIVHKVLKNVFNKEYMDSPQPEDRAHIVYDKIPLLSTVELYKLMRYTRRNLYRIESPTLIFHSTKDEVAHPKSAEELYKRILSPQKHLEWVEGPHIFVNQIDERNQKIAENIARFCKDTAKFFESPDLSRV